jgi:uncharacterized protein
MKIKELNVLDLAGDPRSLLGESVPYFFFRYVSLFAAADALGAKTAAGLREGGRKAGVELVKGMFFRTFDDLVEHFRQHGIGLLSLESQEEHCFKVRMHESVIAHGLPEVGQPLCHFPGGVLAGALWAIGGEPAAGPYDAFELECHGLGHSACLFEIRPPRPEDAE